MKRFETILQRVGDYYGQKVTEHGPTARGADWNSSESQQLRFGELLRVCDRPGRFSLNDFGCGYGALYDLLAERKLDVDYRGFDISAEMLSRAQAQHAGKPSCRFVDELGALEPADYTVASGIFNVKQDSSTDEWQAYVIETLEELARLSRHGFAFNMLTSYSDSDRMRSDLYYGDPCFYFDLCKRTWSKQVALLHDYGLYEFTMLVRLKEADA